jgi:hypothetical protein
MQAQQLQPTTRRSSKGETSGRLGIFMPQISRNENVKNNNKTRDEELAKNNKKYSRHARNTRWTRDTHNQLTSSRAKTKQAHPGMTTTKTKINIFILIKKLKAGFVVVVSFASLTIDSQVKSKEQKERDVSFIFGQLSLILQTPS